MQSTDTSLRYEVRCNLARILTSPEFSRAKQLRILLEFLVDETLEGHAVGIKESTVAAAVFGRDASFDSATDNVVRVEIRRLRERLEQYHQREGWLDPIHIEIPKGAYVPQFIAQDLRESAIGRTLGRHTITTVAAHSVDGTLFRSAGENVGREVLIWLTEPLADVLEVVARCTQLSSVTHPCICVPQEIGTISGRVFMVFPSSAGELLCDRLKTGHLTPPETLALAQHLSQAMGALHEGGMMYGSLRQECLILPEGKPNWALILLLAANPETRPDDTGRSPEQRKGAAGDKRSDVWALGSILDACQSSPGPGKKAPDRIKPMDDLVRRCTQDDPDQRPQSASEVATTLGVISLPISSPPLPPTKGTVLKWAIAAVLALSTVALIWSNPSWLALARNSPPSVRLAILPFVDVGSDPETVLAGKMLADMVGASLANIPGITLVELPSSSQLVTDNLRKQLNITYTMEGSIFKNGDRFTIIAKILRLADASYLWTGSYRGTWQELNGIEDEVAMDAAMALGVTKPLSRRLLTLRVHNPKAIEAWSLGHEATRDSVNNMYLKPIQEPERLLLRAVELDPSFAEPMVDLGFLYWMASFPSSAEQPRRLAAAERWFRMALEKEPDHPLAQAYLGRISFMRGERRAGFRAIQDAARRDPDNPSVRFVLSSAYLGMGFWESAVSELDAVIAKDPLTNLSYDHKAYVLTLLNRPDDALLSLESLPVNSTRRLFGVALIGLRTGRIEDAEAALRKLQSQGMQITNNAIYLRLAAMRGDRTTAVQGLKGIRSGFSIRDNDLLLYPTLGMEKEFLAALPYVTYSDNYRWLVTEPLLRQFVDSPAFQTRVREKFAIWQENLAQFGATLPIPPGPLPTPDEYFHSVTALGSH